MLTRWLRFCLASASLSRPLVEAELSPEADDTPEVVERVEMVEAALELPSPQLANGRSEFRISASAF